MSPVTYKIRVDQPLLITAVHNGRLFVTFGGTGSCTGIFSCMGWSVPLITVLLKGQPYGPRKTYCIVASSVAPSRKCTTCPICAVWEGGRRLSRGPWSQGRSECGVTTKGKPTESPRVWDVSDLGWDTCLPQGKLLTAQPHSPLLSRAPPACLRAVNREDRLSSVHNASPRSMY